MKRLFKMLVFGSALGIIAGFFVIPTPAIRQYWFRAAIALIVTAVSWRLFYRQPKTKDKQTRAWARAMYHNGLISIEELNNFYLTHPED
jgi:uncharacterized membrane protein YfcA